MSDGPRGALAIAGLAAAGFAFALAALVSSQLAIMSVLDAARAERAATQIAESRFTADVIEQTVQRAVEPVAGEAVAAELATAASTDPRVTIAVSDALLAAHGGLVDPDLPSPSDGNIVVDRAIVGSVIDNAARAGIDLDAVGIGNVTLGDATLGGMRLDTIAEQAGLPSVVPSDVPDLGLRRVAETTRVVALIALLAFALLAVFAHPRPGRSVRRLGWSAVVVCGAWLGGLLVAGWAIGRTTNTLFGEMIDTVWSDAVSSMVLLVGAGMLIGAGLWVAGTVVDGATRRPSMQ
jgi:histone H3/H4